jgi:hypothetical protein
MPRYRGRMRRTILLVAIASSVAACGGSGGSEGVDAGRDATLIREDGSAPNDSGPRDDAAVGDDAGTSDDAAMVIEDGGIDACTPPVCPAPPDGCVYEGGSFCECGTLVCETPDACVPPPCPAPPDGCHYEGATMCECGTLVCPTGCAACTRTEYCDYTTDFACDGEGTCQPRPEGCFALFAPVCGCDGNNYSNGCLANAAGTDVASEGRCGGATPDCRTAGCPDGGACMFCFRMWQCLPRGAMC